MLSGGRRPAWHVMQVRLSTLSAQRRRAPRLMSTSYCEEREQLVEHLWVLWVLTRAGGRKNGAGEVREQRCRGVPQAHSAPRAEERSAEPSHAMPCHADPAHAARIWRVRSSAQVPPRPHPSPTTAKRPQRHRQATVGARRHPLLGIRRQGLLPTARRLRRAQTRRTSLWPSLRRS